jgi:hypothetical protein
MVTFPFSLLCQYPLYVEYLKQTKMSFSKTGEQEGKTGPVWGLTPM